MTLTGETMMTVSFDTNSTVLPLYPLNRRQEPLFQPPQAIFNTPQFLSSAQAKARFLSIVAGAEARVDDLNQQLSERQSCLSLVDNLLAVVDQYFFQPRRAGDPRWSHKPVCRMRRYWSRWYRCSSSNVRTPARAHICCRWWIACLISSDSLAAK